MLTFVVVPSTKDAASKIIRFGEVLDFQSISSLIDQACDLVDYDRKI